MTINFKEGLQMTVSKAIKTISEALKTDDAYYISWKANIAMAFKDQYSRNKKKYKSKKDVHIMANLAADHFIDLLIMDSDK